MAEAVTRAGNLDQAAIGAEFHKGAFPTVIGDLKFDEKGEWAEERNLYVQYQGVSGNDLEQFKKPGVQVILYPDRYKSGQAADAVPGDGVRRRAQRGRRCGSNQTQSGQPGRFHSHEPAPAPPPLAR